MLRALACLGTLVKGETSRPFRDPEERNAPDVLTDVRVARPPLYRVILLNDDYTPMQFVVDVLQRFFGKDEASAVSLMLAIHHQGSAVVGIFSFEIAETKVSQVAGYARVNQHPLRCVLEKEDA